MNCRVICALMLFCIVSCWEIDTHYRDEFEGVWESEYLPLGDMAEAIVLDIHQDSADVIIDSKAIYSGSYNKDAGLMVMGWDIEWHGIDFLFLDARLASDDEMLLRWKPHDFWYPYTTRYLKH